MKLAAGDWVADFRPECGGAVASLTRRGIDILRASPAAGRDPLAFANFPLVPYANRIADGAFTFDGKAHRLERNYPGQDHPLHGVGWLSAWSVEAADATTATLCHHHDGDAAWPWRYAATQRIALDEHGLRIVLDVVNEGTRPMPVSLGFHPYFARDGVRSLAFRAEGVWLADDAMLPTVHAPADALGDWAAGAPVTSPTLIDNCYTDWTGDVRIDRDDGAVTLSGAATPMLHLYLPLGEPYFCAEPVTAMPDAVNRGPIDTIAPGERREIAMAIRG